MIRLKYNKIETDVLGTSLYFKEDNHNYDYENSYSDSDIKSLIFAEGINGIFTNGTDDYGNAIFEGDKVVYKDENAENQYIVEFKDSHPEMMLEIRIDIISLNSDNFNTGDEIKIK